MKPKKLTAKDLKKQISLLEKENMILSKSCQKHELRSKTFEHELVQVSRQRGDFAKAIVNLKDELAKKDETIVALKGTCEVLAKGVKTKDGIIELSFRNYWILLACTATFFILWVINIL